MAVVSFSSGSQFASPAGHLYSRKSHTKTGYQQFGGKGYFFNIFLQIFIMAVSGHLQKTG
jgi:hypothetical protein